MNILIACQLANKIQANLHVPRNIGVGGNTKLLPERLAEAKEQYGHLTDDQLNEYKNSHGCVRTTY